MTIAVTGVSLYNDVFKAWIVMKENNGERYV